jgi:hypothetical protein
MPKRKIPHDAFYHYVGLGPARSYQRVAEHYGVTKRAVVNVAAREGWQEQAAELERKARQRANDRAEESLEAMTGRHLKSLRVVQAKALEALKAMPLDSAIAAVRALDTGIRQERVIRGEPGERSAVSLEETIRREYERWMDVAGDDEDGEEEAEGEIPAKV